MHVQSHFAQTELPALHGLMREHPLGTWVGLCEGELTANLMPFVLDATAGEFGTLRGHLPRANPAWQTASAEHASLVLFHGPQQYISPSWYPSKHAHGKAVPTWNYMVVQARGTPRFIDDRDWLLEHLNTLTDIHEARQHLPWKVSDAPAEYLDRMLEHIVGIELRIEQLSGKWKLSQNRPEADRLGVVAGLSAQPDPASQQMAERVRTAMPTTPR
jgi:transcriptional regulator